ncbi:hypothetical protein GQ53DRAFT_753271 [Thozetella sp. PMI_491]|nr:hypothetical protein GQ53DRAFT_753271 [Thozetella sp. PMI_491]
MFPSQLMAAATAWGVLVPVALGLPQTQAPPVITPTVDSLNMSGPGCPLGAGGIVKGVKNSTPVFLFTEWEISRADADANASSVSKWCTQQMALSSIPSGQQIRLSNVNISGWATLDPESKLELSFETRLGDLSAVRFQQLMLPCYCFHCD